MRRTPLKRKSKNPRKVLLAKADRLLQDYYRLKWKDKPCMCCNEKMELCHHFVLKSHSNRLRFEELNLIPICNFCHSKVHGFHGEILNGLIILSKGEKWLKEISRLKQDTTYKLPITRLRELIEFYQEKINELK